MSDTAAPTSVPVAASDQTHPTAPPTARWVALCLLTVGAVLGAWPAWSDMFRIGFKDEEASQVLLAPVVFGWLLALRRHHLQQAKLTGNWIGPVMVLLGWGVSYYGFYHAMQALWHGGAVLAATGAAVTLLEFAVLKRLWPALLVLLFLVPVPGQIRQQIAIPMMTYTAGATHFVFELLGLGVERNGNLLSYNGNDVTVAEACNGMRMIFVLVLVSYAAAFSMPMRAYVRVLILLLSPATAIICNVIRLVPTVLFFGMAPDAEWPHLFHDLSGWVMIGVAYVLVMAVVQLLKWLDLPVEPAPQTTRKAPA